MHLDKITVKFGQTQPAKDLEEYSAVATVMHYYCLLNFKIKCKNVKKATSYSETEPIWVFFFELDHRVSSTLLMEISGNVVQT